MQPSESSLPSKRILVAIVLSLIVLALSSTVELTVSAQMRDGDNRIIYQTVDLAHLSQNLQEYEGVNIKTTGIVLSEGYGSIYMFEDFWLQAQNNANAKIMVQLFNGLSVPSNSSLIVILGKIEHSNLEGGFYFLNASTWTTLNSPTATPTHYNTPEPTLPQTLLPTPVTTIQPANPLTNNPSDPSNSFLGKYGFVLILFEVVAIVIGGFLVYVLRIRKRLNNI